MKIIVITGSTRGIGRGLAEEFLKRGHTVIISGRTDRSTQAALNELLTIYDGEKLLAQPCDVADHTQVQALWDAALERFGRVDIWINNAGMSNLYRPVWEQDFERMQAIINTNVLGAMYGTNIAYLGMLAQGHGKIFNMEGAGSNGRKQFGLSIYSTSKAALTFFTEAFIKEMDGESPVQIGLISPGMIVTDLITTAYEDPAEFEKYKRIFNIICDKVETVTPYLVEKMLASNQNGTRIRWITSAKIMLRFLLAPFNKRDLFADEPAG